MISEYIPEEAQAIIESYKRLRIRDDKTVRCPYYRNPRSGRERWGLNAFSGKGSPQELEGELRIIEKLENKDFMNMGEEEIRDIMRKRRLGIDCSGFIAHIFDAWTMATKKKRLYQLLNFPAQTLWGRLATTLRPFTHINIDTLVRPKNATEFTDYQELRVGDLIRFNTEVDHAILVTRLQTDASGGVLRNIWYVQSVKEKVGEGIKEGLVRVNNNTLPIVQQHWEEYPETGLTINRQGYPKFYHPRFLS